MRSIEEIRDTGSAWVTEAELAMLCAFAKRAETSEMEVVEKLEGMVDLSQRNVELVAENARLRAQISGRTLVPELVELQRENARLRSALAVGVEAVVNLCMHLYLTPIEAHWHDGPRQDLRRMGVALAPEVKPGGSACADRAETVEQTHARWSAEKVKPEPFSDAACGPRYAVKSEHG